MADAKKCDRCGRFFAVTDVQNGAILELAESVCNLLNRKTDGEKFADGANEEICDLCDECKQSLAKWFDEGAKEAAEVGGS